ncbi:Kelch repeat-containing protein [Hymenobacter jeollabukensis]|uniref:Galactose oxidase n=1 Tax=Hymenobacter jeollabukensis TaxID=2025313 RepID=A0A5R8WVX7_9BACT|nr:kelch repeat-containing protein [Hymenobacter jeollabukensis]TLM95585.1 galactose oxidase [Hymenobacter jeollabukensis]
MKRYLPHWLLVLAVLCLAGCNDDDTSTDEDILGVWSGRSQFEGLARNAAVSFTIGDKAYVGLGTNGTSKFVDFWEYNPATNTWTQKADFPGVGRYLAVGFSANGKGYVGTGYDGANKLRDFYEYDPAANQWTRKADFGGTARYGAVALSIAGKGYIGTGFDGNAKKDFWQYDPATDQWTQKPSFGGNKRQGAVAFTLNNQGYLLLGADNGSYMVDVWSYDPGNELWSQHRELINSTDYDYDYSALPRSNATAFVVGTHGFVALGTNGSTLTSCYEYDPDADTWTQKTSFGGVARTYPVSFGLGNRGYVGLGLASALRLDDLWQIAPNESPD